MIGLIIWLCSIELAQMILLEGRTADVTEPLLLILVGLDVSRRAWRSATIRTTSGNHHIASQ